MEAAYRAGLEEGDDSVIQPAKINNTLIDETLEIGTEERSLLEPSCVSEDDDNAKSASVMNNKPKATKAARMWYDWLKES